MKTITKIVTVVTMITSGLTTISATELSGEQLLTTNCITCHATQHAADESTMIAPPIMGVIRHVKEKYPNKEDAVAFMVDYFQNPTKDKAACEPKSIERFGLMPSLKGAVSPEDLEKIASYAYDTYPNGNGKGKGRGKGKGKKGQGKGQNKQGNDKMSKGNKGQGGEGKGQGQGKGKGQGQGQEKKKQNNL